MLIVYHSITCHRAVYAYIVYVLLHNLCTVRNLSLLEPPRCCCGQSNDAVCFLGGSYYPGIQSKWASFGFVWALSFPYTQNLILWMWSFNEHGNLRKMCEQQLWSIWAWVETRLRVHKDSNVGSSQCTSYQIYNIFLIIWNPKRYITMEYSYSTRVSLSDSFLHCLMALILYTTDISPNNLQYSRKENIVETLKMVKGFHMIHRWFAALRLLLMQECHRFVPDVCYVNFISWLEFVIFWNVKSYRADYLVWIRLRVFRVGEWLHHRSQMISSTATHATVCHTLMDSLITMHWCSWDANCDVQMQKMSYRSESNLLIRLLCIVPPDLWGASPCMAWLQHVQSPARKFGTFRYQIVNHGTHSIPNFSRTPSNTHIN